MWLFVLLPVLLGIRETELLSRIYVYFEGVWWAILLRPTSGQKFCRTLFMATKVCLGYVPPCMSPLRPIPNLWTKDQLSIVRWLFGYLTLDCAGECDAGFVLDLRFSQTSLHEVNGTEHLGKRGGPLV